MWVVGGEFLHSAPSDNIVTHWGALFMYSGFMGSGQIILADQKDLYNWTFQVPLTPITKVTAMKRKVTDEDEQEEAKGDKQEVAGAEKGKEDENRDTLDKFMANHTSEDNKSFTNLQVEHEKKHGEKNVWMYKDEAMYLEMKAQQMALPSMEQQAALPSKTGNVDTWTYQNRTQKGGLG